mmetsp:Transcript_89066/g.154465  ORF Transcript_89066/g.154465 Transcript_89066/m.154465 type:complete len:233 (+) Transcript_89066:204-902(+)
MYLTLTFHPFPTLASSFAPRSHVAPHEELIVVYVCLCVALQRELTCRTVRNVDARLVFQVHDFSDPNTPHQKSFLVTSVFFRSRRTILLGHGTLQFALFVSCLSLAREFWIPASCGGYSSNSSRVRERMPLVAISLPPYPLLFPLFWHTFLCQKEGSSTPRCPLSFHSLPFFRSVDAFLFLAFYIFLTLHFVSDFPPGGGSDGLCYFPSLSCCFSPRGYTPFWGVYSTPGGR